ncbi:MAG: cysteine--tRNA ligase [Candidatus Levybacteria bacterium]|nr:cysteine--tRNA ligase [Candidatus Levybacteria bacterium]
MKIYNSLSKKIEDFKPVNPPYVGMYTCGPTVYDFAHIGNLRTYTTADLLVRTLKYNGYDVKYVMNLTDVGHLTGDNLGDADTGEDRMEKAAKKEGKTAWDIARFYTDAFLKDYKRLNLSQPLLFAKATDHIQEQIKLVQVLEKKGFTYKTSDGIYFDTSKFPQYGQLSSLDQIKEGARVEINPEKKNPRDFALWKFSDIVSQRQMEWESPWGFGFPGWHIECSAMSLKYLGEAFENDSFHGEASRTIDIHVGGMDLKEIHHPNEIAQAEAATSRPFVNYWVHGAFMLVDGKRMSKSLGNNYKVEDILSNGFDPLTLRYLYMQTHYHQEMNFTWEAMEASQNALNKLKDIVSYWSEDPKIGCADFEQKFLDAVNDNLNMPRAISIMWELIHSNYPNSAKLESLYKIDEVLGLNLKQVQSSKFKVQSFNVPEEVQKLVKEREELRKQKSFHLADQLRDKIEKLGYEIQDLDNDKVNLKKISLRSL